MKYSVFTCTLILLVWEGLSTERAKLGNHWKNGIELCFLNKNDPGLIFK